MLYRALFMLGICLLPIYLWESGGIQISHMLIAIAALCLFAVRGIRFTQADALLLSLVAFVAIRETVAVIAGYSPNSLMAALYILFNAVIFNSVRAFSSERQSFRLIGLSLTIAVAIAVLGVLVKGYSFRVDSEGYRAIGTFNNPNQLGYFAVCSFSIAILLYQSRVIVKKVYLFVFFLTAAYLSAASLSKAAMITTMLSGTMIGFSLRSSRRSFFVGVTMALMVLGLAFALYQSGSMSDLKVVQRLSTLGSQDDDSLAERGYDVVLQGNAIEVFVGMGGQKVKQIVGHEVHSTFFSFFGSYGVIGGTGFLLFLAMWVKKLVGRYGGLIAASIWGPPLVYGITHNGSRFTIFWILIAMSFVTTSSKQIRAESRDSASNP